MHELIFLAVTSLNTPFLINDDFILQVKLQVGKNIVELLLLNTKILFKNIIINIGNNFLLLLLKITLYNLIGNCAKQQFYCKNYIF